MALPDAAARPAAARAAVARRRLIINADDFGRSAEINDAIIEARTRGVLTTASLMVNEEGFDEAVKLARNHPSLGVGLHLSLVCGRSALPQAAIPGLVNHRQQFTNCPVTAGFNYFFRPSLRDQLRAEIEAQFERFAGTGLVCDHVNGHLHLHLHPTVFPFVLDCARRHAVRGFRLTRDPWTLNARLATGRWPYRLSHAIIFRNLSQRAARRVRDSRLAHTPRVFGLLQDGRVDEKYVTALLPELPPGDSELYCHPSLSHFRHELDALLSPEVKRLVAELDIELIRYQDI